MFRIGVLILMLFVATRAHAQSHRPFFYPGVDDFDSEVRATLNGNRIEPRVIAKKPDLLHVNMGVGGGSVYVNGEGPPVIEFPERPLGFVGGAKPTATGTMVDASILNRRGMFFLAGL